MANHFDSRELLARYGVEEGDLLATIRNKHPVDGVLLAGSIVEGLGTENSDVDVIVIGEQAGGDGIEFVSANSKSLVINTTRGTLLDITVITREQLRACGSRLAAAIAAVDAHARGERPRKLQNLEYGDLLMLHRIASGAVLAGQDEVARLRDEYRLPRMSDYLFHRNMLTYAGRREDARAQVADGHRLSALHMLQEAATLAGAAWLASVGETNPHMKWRARLIEKHMAALDTDEPASVFRAFYVPLDADPQAVADALFGAVDEMLGRVFSRRPELGAQALGGLANLQWQRNNP